MRWINLAGSCLNQTPLDFGGNLARILKAMEAARSQGAHVLCLPEMAISGYGCEDTFFSSDVLTRSWQSLERVVVASEGLFLTVGLPVVFEQCIYNASAVVHNGKLLGLVAKQELAGDGIYYEPRWFKPWKQGIVAQYEWPGGACPMGDLIFDLDGVRIGLEICEDAWNGERPAQRHYLHNVDVILNPSASNFAFGKSAVRERLVTEASRSFNCAYVYSNLLGNESGRIIFDGEILVSQAGDLLARNRRFRMADTHVLTAAVDVERVHIPRRKSFNFSPNIPTHLISAAEPLASKPKAPAVEIWPLESKEEEFLLAETLGLWDYMRKSRSRGFMLSLSGGADSSTCAVLCAQAFQRAVAELGEAAVRAELAYAKLHPDQPLVEQLLTCVYQATRNSGEATHTSAQELARSLGAFFIDWNVEKLHAEYLALGEIGLGRPLTWETDDVALQNIQARLRAPGIWLLANVKGSLLLTTSNRSEAAVGYATMDGDTSGGLAPLGGVDKAFIIRWLKWAENQLGIGALQYVNNLQPTAELRPAGSGQTDEKDLMPYPILDEIEECAIRDYKSPAEVYHTLRGICPDEDLKAYIRKFFRLWSRNQWKRERYAPSFHLDDKNLDPKTWCRFPILNGGFEAGLRELDSL